VSDLARKKVFRPDPGLSGLERSPPARCRADTYRLEWGRTDEASQRISAEELKSKQQLNPFWVDEQGRAQSWYGKGPASVLERSTRRKASDSLG